MNEAMHALNRLLEMQNDLERYGTSGQFSISEQRKILNAIEKALKALEIIVDKSVNPVDVRCCDDVDVYNVKENGNNPLTKGEFALLKETFE